MSDFITMTCPACGGKLEVNPSQQLLTCQHCGTEHMIRHEADSVRLEAFARCPRCSRNDRVEKVSSILRNQVKEVSQTKEVLETYVDQKGKTITRKRLVPVNSTEVSILAQSLQTPAKPLLGSGSSKYSNLAGFLYVGGALSVLASCAVPAVILMETSSMQSADWFAAILGMGCTFGVAAGAAAPLIFLGMMVGKKDKAQKEEVQATQEEQTRLWQRAVERWQAAYYCHRDDCVFVPGENRAYSIERVHELWWGH